MAALARRVVDDVVAADPESAARVPIAVEALEGVPADVLVDRAMGADLLVVGHRGRGAFRSAVLGSVGLRCVLHASCPVTVVRPYQRAPQEAGRGGAAERAAASR